MSVEIKAKSIVITGLTEEVDETPYQRAFYFLANIDTKFKQEEVDIAYRVGNNDQKAQEQQQPQSLIVVFMDYHEVSIMSLKNKLRKDVDHNKIFVNDDLPPDVRQSREEMREISNYAKEKGYTSKVSGSKHLVNNKVHQSHELDLLPN